MCSKPTDTQINSWTQADDGGTPSLPTGRRYRRRLDTSRRRRDAVATPNGGTPSLPTGHRRYSAWYFTLSK
ncbi:MAG: hypothetical protein IKP87_08280, partial [Victivallales bacterium]|nr:hypothetical protein [Victivallales bacterium]